MRISAERRARYTQRILLALLIAGVLSIVFGTWAWSIGTSGRQNVAESLSKTAVGKSQRADAKAVALSSKTSALSAEQERIRELAIKNCQALRDYLSSSVETRKETEANANRIAVNDVSIAAEMDRFPGRQKVAALFQARSVLNLQRAHIARRGQHELMPIIQASCTLPLQVGK